MRITPAARIGAGALIIGLLTAISPSANAAGPTKIDFSCGGLGDCQVVAQAPGSPAGPAPVASAPAAPVSQSTGGSSGGGATSGGNGGGGAGSSSGPAVPAGPSLDGYGSPLCSGWSGSGCASYLASGPAAQQFNTLNASGQLLCNLGNTATCPTPAAPAAPAAPGAPPAAPPPPPPPSPAQVAQIAISQMKLQPVGIGIVPEDKPGKIGVVGMPTWMWANNPGESTTGPMTRSATAGPVTVTAVATLDRVVWNMGDGSSVTCHGAGVPYSGGWGAQDSPTCGHRYQHTSEDQSGMAYTVTATSYWNIVWAGGGGAGVVPQQVAANTRIQVGEFQAIVTHSS